MATVIEFGGAPTLYQRKQFTKLKDCSQVKGYTGNMPQLQYHSGKTHGQTTHDLAKEYEFDHPVMGSNTDEEVDIRIPVYENELPKMDADNKYIEDMKAGYSGFVPRKIFLGYGMPFNYACNRSIDDHLTLLKKHQRYEEQLRADVIAFPTLQTLDHDPKDHLETFRDTHPQPPILYEHKRLPLEPPLFNYGGHVVPKVRTTELGVGARNFEVCRNSLVAFNHEQDAHFDIIQRPISVTNQIMRKCPSNTADPVHPPVRRIYHYGGLIPRYKGYVPLARFEFGETFRNLTSKRPCCSHGMTSYGDFLTYSWKRNSTKTDQIMF